MLNKFLLFAAGALIGSVVTSMYFKSKYEVIEEEETIEKPDESQIDISEKEPKIAEEAEKIIRDYHTESNSKEVKEPVVIIEEDDGMEGPYVISPDEFDENGYETVSLTYYADGVLTDEMDNIIDDIDEVIGEESLEHFGEFEEDSVFVRDDDKEIDYEILKDLRNYRDVYPDRPY